nr:MAG TPA: hypothetical protein [Caudoviricetes sp.]
MSSSCLGLSVLPPSSNFYISKLIIGVHSLDSSNYPPSFNLDTSGYSRLIIGCHYSYLTSISILSLS